MGVRFTLSKSEILRNTQVISAIFNKEGTAIFKAPILFIYLPIDQAEHPAQVLFSVSKRKFKKAHDRNRIKRLLREVYRLNKHRIYSAIPEGKQYAIGLLFLGTTVPEYHSIEKNVTCAIDEFIERIS